jgi:DNA-binding response OmpR family regulator
MPKKILIVEDEADLLKLTEFRLKKCGYSVSTAANGQQGLDMLRKDPPDLALLDLRLPGVSGDVLCKIIKSDPGMKDVKVMIFTASVAVDISDRMSEIKADDWIIKPFDPKVLLDKIKNLLCG